MKYFFGLLVPCYVLDQLTKWWVTRTIPFGDGQTVIPGFFDLVYWGNTGAAFSILQGQSWFFIILAVVTLGVLAVMGWRGAIRDKASKVAFSILAAGILGNLTDRVIHGHVVDFLLFNLHVPFASPWPAFNVADSCICVAAGLLIRQSFQHDKTRNKLE